MTGLVNGAYPDLLARLVVNASDRTILVVTAKVRIVSDGGPDFTVQPIFWVIGFFLAKYLATVGIERTCRNIFVIKQITPDVFGISTPRIRRRQKVPVVPAVHDAERIQLLLRVGALGR